MQKLEKYLADNMEIDLYDVICEIARERQERKAKDGKELIEKEIRMTRKDFIVEIIRDFLYYAGEVSEIDLKKYKEDNNDFWNDENRNDIIWCDIVSEWADGRVEIYNYTLWQEAPIFSDYIEEALDEYGFDKERGMIGILQMGQYRFYSDVGNDILGNIKKYVDEEII